MTGSSLPACAEPELIQGGMGVAGSPIVTAGTGLTEIATILDGRSSHAARDAVRCLAGLPV